MTDYLTVNFKLEPGATMPKYARPGDAGLDLVAISWYYDDGYSYYVYNTGVRVEIPDGYFGLLVPNSRVAKKHLFLANSVGVIDSGFRGELKFIYKPIIDSKYTFGGLDIYNTGDVVGQLLILPIPHIVPIQVDTLSDTERGENGFGSTAK